MYLDLLKIYKHNFQLKRFGRNGDGGYVMPSDIKFDTILSCGINNEISFENDWISTNKNVKIYAYDGTILEFPSENKKNFIWEKLNIGKSDTKTTISLNTIFDKFNLKNVLAKIDIEGFEYEAFSTFEKQNYDKIDILLLEVHDIRKRKLEFETLMKTLNENFVLIHKHINDCGHKFYSDNKLLGEVYELTFVNKKYISEKIENDIILPIENLDYSNML